MPITLPIKLDRVQLFEFFGGVGSPGLVVMGGDSCSEGRGFESRCYILDGHNICIVCLKRPKINYKEAGINSV